MTEWEADKSWADGYMDDVRAVLGKVFFATAPLALDMEQATDLVLATGPDDLRVGVRCRRSGSDVTTYTIRYGRPSGARTEFDKILQAAAEGRRNFFLFYGVVGTVQPFDAWTVINLHEWAAYIANHLAGGGDLPYRTNPDGTSYIELPIRDLPAKAIVDLYRRQLVLEL